MFLFSKNSFCKELLESATLHNTANKKFAILLCRQFKPGNDRYDIRPSTKVHKVHSLPFSEPPLL